MDRAEAAVAPRHVMLFEDRAHVVRRGTVAVAAGMSEVTIDGVAPVLSDRSLRCRVLAGPPGTRLAAARVRRTAVVNRSELPEESKRLQQALEELSEGLAREAPPQTVEGSRASSLRSLRRQSTVERRKQTRP